MSGLSAFDKLCWAVAAATILYIGFNYAGALIDYAEAKRAEAAAGVADARRARPFCTRSMGRPGLKKK